LTTYILSGFACFAYRFTAMTSY